MVSLTIRTIILGIFAGILMGLSVMGFAFGTAAVLFNRPDLISTQVLLVCLGNFLFGRTLWDISMKLWELGHAQKDLQLARKMRNPAPHS